MSANTQNILALAQVSEAGQFVVLVLASFRSLRRLNPDNNGKGLDIGRTRKNSRRCG
jgi:hypothetical protein